jgi:hypothetical protein
MADFLAILTYVFAAMGLTILIVWPADGPSAWLRDKIVRKLLWPSARGVLDCYICLSVWVALALAPAWWYWVHCQWVWTGPLVLPALFWMILRPWHSASEKQLQEPVDGKNTDESASPSKG